jgi:hypothetical protein
MSSKNDIEKPRHEIVLNSARVKKCSVSIYFCFGTQYMKGIAVAAASSKLVSYAKLYMTLQNDITLKCIRATTSY